MQFWAIMHLTERRYHDTAIVVAPAKGAAGAPELNPSLSPADGFGSIDDILNEVGHVVERANRRLAAQNIDVLNRYLKGEVAAYIGIYDGRSEGQYHLVFRRFPAETVVSEIANMGVPNGMLNIEVDGGL